MVDDYGTVAIMEAAAFREDEVDLRLVEYADGSAATESPIFLALAACLIKGEKFELVVQKAVELGVNRLVPLSSENTVVKLEARKAAACRERWQKIADEAAKQCGRTRLMTVEGVKPLNLWLDQEAREEIAGEQWVFLPTRRKRRFPLVNSSPTGSKGRRRRSVIWPL